MKKYVFLIFVVCFLFTGCSSSAGQMELETEPESLAAATEATETVSYQETSASTEQLETAVRVYPLPDTTMDSLSDTTVSISLEEGDAYVDDTGKMQMDIKIYSYDKYDMVAVSALKVGDVLVTHSGEVEITSLDRKEDGAILINGGLEEDGLDLVTDETGIYYEWGYNDAKNWYEIGEATIRVSADFIYHDTSNLDSGEILYYPGSFLVGEVTDYNFTPYNTTIRIENSQIMEMYRVYIP